ncbi:MAG: DUF4236 domain-containing protein [Acidobacteriota bacterium]|nr:DUF4236 domain-containing protein [Acidobacteriota bacterium]
MGWRFRKSFSPLPGVRLNFSPRGISTSVGAGPFRFHVGSQGAAVTTRIPGTGISYRQPLHLPHPKAEPQTEYPTQQEPQPQAILPSPPAGTEIRSASTATLTTEGLEPVKELLTKAQEERSRLLPELLAAQGEAARLKNKHQRWANGWLIRRLFKGRFIRLGEMATEAADKQAELEEQERLSRLATEFDLPDNLKNSFGRLCDAVAGLAQSQRIWKTLTIVATDRYRERTTASQSIQRQPVDVSLGSCDLIQSSLNVPRLQTAYGGEMFFYPAFVLYFVSPQAFALVDIHDVRLNYNPASFIEEEAAPSDAELIGHTWKKANKDGSPDRRFAHNYQIPILKYGDIRLTSHNGLNEAYMISNERLAYGLAQAFANFQRTLPAATA